MRAARVEAIYHKKLRESARESAQKRKEHIDNLLRVGREEADAIRSGKKPVTVKQEEDVFSTPNPPKQEEQLPAWKITPGTARTQAHEQIVTHDQEQIRLKGDNDSRKEKQAEKLRRIRTARQIKKEAGSSSNDQTTGPRNMQNMTPLFDHSLFREPIPSPPLPSSDMKEMLEYHRQQTRSDDNEDTKLKKEQWTNYQQERRDAKKEARQARNDGQPSSLAVYKRDEHKEQLEATRRDTLDALERQRMNSDLENELLAKKIQLEQEDDLKKKQMALDRRFAQDQTTQKLTEEFIAKQQKENEVIEEKMTTQVTGKGRTMRRLGGVTGWVGETVFKVPVIGKYVGKKPATLTEKNQEKQNIADATEKHNAMILKAHAALNSDLHRPLRLQDDPRFSQGEQTLDQQRGGVGQSDNVLPPDFSSGDRFEEIPEATPASVVNDGIMRLGR
jgi:hypothetical protein